MKINFGGKINILPEIIRVSAKSQMKLSEKLKEKTHGHSQTFVFHSTMIYTRLILSTAGMQPISPTRCIDAMQCMEVAGRCACVGWC